MSVSRFSECVGYEPDLNGCRKKIVEYCQYSEGTIDRLQQENAELKSALKSMIGKGIDLLNVEDVSDEEDAFSIHSKFNDAIINSERLLVKLNKND